LGNLAEARPVWPRLAFINATRTTEAKMTNASTTWQAHTESTVPENYEKFFVRSIARPLAVDLIEEAALRPGERVLDVACGTGIVARLAGEQVGESGSVAGLDVNPGFLAVARATAAESGANIRWYETSAESMPLPDQAFDVVLCQLSLQFIEDKVAALGEMRRVLAPGSRVLVNVPRPGPFHDAFEDALRRHAGEPAGAFLKAVFSLGDTDQVDRLLRDAGFKDVTVRAETKNLQLPPANEFLWQYIHSLPLAGMVASLDDEQADAFERDIVERWKPWSDDGGMMIEQGTVVATGRR